MKSIKLWILGIVFAVLGLLIFVWLESLILLAPFSVMASGITTYYALKAERREGLHGRDTDKKD